MAHKRGFKTVFSDRKLEKLFIAGKIEKKYRLLSTPNSIDQNCEKSVLIWSDLTQGKGLGSDSRQNRLYLFLFFHAVNCQPLPIKATVEVWSIL